MHLRKYNTPACGPSICIPSSIPSVDGIYCYFSTLFFRVHPPLVIILATDFVSSSLPMVVSRHRQAESDLQMRAWLAKGAADGSRRRPQDEKFTAKAS